MSRAIDADALIEILSTAIRNMQGVAKFVGVEDDPEIKMEIKAYTDILNGVKEQPTIEPEPHWIPCSERLPDKPNMYYVTDSKGDVVRFVFYGNESSREYWRRCAKAWMPIPTPYQKEGD